MTNNPPTESTETMTNPDVKSLWVDMQLLADKIENGHIGPETAAEQLRTLTPDIPPEDESPGNTDEPITHAIVEAQLLKHQDWPQYYASGEDVDKEDFVPAYYKVEGPNGPVSYMNPNTGPFPTTMYDFAMEAQSDSFHWCEKQDTPWD